MDDKEETGIDPAIAEAMGFAGFGSQAGKKRKYDSNEAFVAPAIDTSHQAPSNGRSIQTGGIQLPPRPKQDAAPINTVSTSAQLPHGDSESSKVSTALRSQSTDHDPFKSGVPNEHGDIAYFLPSFIEDPWRHLRAR